MDLNELLKKQFINLSNGTIQEVRLYQRDNIVLSIVDINNLDPWDQDETKLLYFIEDYILKLRSADIRLPVISQPFVKDKKIYQFKEFIEESFEEKVINARLEELITLIDLILSIAERTDNEVGLDPSPKNFRMRGSDVYYVDFFFPYSRSYVDWKRSRIDLTSPIGRKYFCVQDMFFIPYLYLHLAKDFAKTKSEFESDIVDHIADRVDSSGVFSKEDFLKTFINSKRMMDL